MSLRLLEQPAPWRAALSERYESTREWMIQRVFILMMIAFFLINAGGFGVAIWHIPY